MAGALYFMAGAGLWLPGDMQGDAALSGLLCAKPGLIRASICGLWDLN